MSKRAKGEGNIYHDTTRNRWQGKLTMPDGRRKSVYGPTQREVQSKLRALRREVEAGLHGSTSGEQTFHEFATGWLAHHRSRLEPQSVITYAVILRHHFGALARVPLVKLTPVAIQRQYTALLADHESTTVHGVHMFFHAVLENAVRLGILPRNPTDGVDVPPVKTKEFRPLSESEALQLVDALAGDPQEAVFVLALATGMREAELLGLRWDDIDGERRQVRVDETLHRLDGMYSLRRTKNLHSRRTIPLPDYALSILTAHRQRQAEARALMGSAWLDTWELVFTTAAGAPTSADGLLRAFRKILRSAGLPVSTRVHDLRHTFATLLIERGVHIKVVSELLGHSSVEITLRVYGHVTPRMRDNAVVEMNALLPAVSDQQFDSIAKGDVE